MFTPFSSICSCVSLFFSTAPFLFENETHKPLEKMEIGKKKMILTVVSIFSYSKIVLRAVEIQKVKLQAVQDHFIESVQNDYIQEQLLQEGPETL